VLLVHALREAGLQDVRPEVRVELGGDRLAGLPGERRGGSLGEGGSRGEQRERERDEKTGHDASSWIVRRREYSLLLPRGGEERSDETKTVRPGPGRPRRRRPNGSPHGDGRGRGAHGPPDSPLARLQSPGALRLARASLRRPRVRGARLRDDGGVGLRLRPAPARLLGLGEPRRLVAHPRGAAEADRPRHRAGQAVRHPRQHQLPPHPRLLHQRAGDGAGGPLLGPQGGGTRPWPPPSSTGRPSPRGTRGSPALGSASTSSTSRRG
jgi:hypothetical protein